MTNINFNTFLLLDDYANILLETARIIESDKTLSTIIAEKMVKIMPGSYIISEYIFFEITTVFNICIEPQKTPLNIIKAYPFVFMGLKFYNHKFANFSYIQELLRGEHKEISEYYINYSLKVKEYNDALSEISLLFPTILKSSKPELFDKYSTTLYRFCSLVLNLDTKFLGSEEKTLKKIWHLTHQPGEPLSHSIMGTTDLEPEESLEEILNELNNLIGLSKVKKEVSTLVNFIKIQKERETQGLLLSPISYHCVFTGAPGTGKTTVARIVAKIYKKLGVLTKGQLVETDRSGLIAEYSGQTSIKVDKVVQSALDGVLFIDEAYSLVGENMDDYGKEAVASLVKRMEDYRSRFVLIVAGYPDEMEDFINNNPGFKSRFNKYIHFDDYSAKELLEIFESFCKKSDYKLTKKARGKLLKQFEGLIENKDESFGNARLSRNIFEKSIENQANRLSLMKKALTKEMLITIDQEDIEDNS